MKRLLVWGVPVALLIVLIPAVWWGRLPDPMASHWGVSGEPDSSLPKAAALALPLVLWGVVLVFTRSMPPLTAGMGAMAVLLQGATVWANLDRADWQDARPLPVWLPVLLIAVPLLAGWIGLRLVRVPDVPAEPGETLKLSPGERAVWVSRCTNSVLLVLGYVLLVGGVVLLVTGGRAAGAPAPALLIAGLLSVLFGTVRVKVDERGVSVAYGPWGFPVWRRKLAAIASAKAENLTPSQVGGWGLRGLPPRTALMLRGGECLVLEYGNGGRFTISVDDAARGAALVNTLKSRQGL